MSSHIPRPTSPSAGEQRLAQADSMAPPSPLAEVKSNRDPRNSNIVPVFKMESKTKLKSSRTYRSADTSDKGIPFIPGTMNIVVGAESTNQRTWTLPKALLSQHSDIFNSIITADDTVSEIQLPTIRPNAFANFVSYMYSSIYSTNTQVSGYRSIRAHADACLLAAKLEANDYWQAAMRKLYDLFLPLAKSRRSDAKQSFIRAGDIGYICANTTDDSLRCTVTIKSAPLASNSPINLQIEATAEDGSSGAPPAPPRKGYHSYSVGAMKGLRTLFFDALASHWTQGDVVYIGAQSSPRGGGFNKNDVPGDSTTWRQVCDAYPEFHFHIAKTSGILLGWRTSLLKHVNNYLIPGGLQSVRGPGGGSGDVARKKMGVDNVMTRHIEDVNKIREEEAGDDEELEMEKATRRPKLTLKLKGLKGGTGGDGTEFPEQVVNNVTTESDKAITSEEETLGDGENDERVESEASTLIDGETGGEEEVPQDEETTEGVDTGIDQDTTSAGY